MNYFRITESHFKQLADGIMAEVTILNGEKETVIDANGNGRLDAVSNAVKQFFNIDYLDELRRTCLSPDKSFIKAIACLHQKEQHDLLVQASTNIIKLHSGPVRQRQQNARRTKRQRLRRRPPDKNADLHSEPLPERDISRYVTGISPDRAIHQ